YAYANEVAQYVIAAGAAVQQHFILAVAVDEVARRVIGPAVTADGVARALHFDAIATIGKDHVAANVDADVIAVHRLCGGGAVQQHAIAAVAGDDVFIAQNTAAESVAAAGVLNADLVGHSRGAG